jgi:hypothetical protein
MTIHPQNAFMRLFLVSVEAPEFGTDNHFDQVMEELRPAAAAAKRSASIISDFLRHYQRQTNIHCSSPRTRRPAKH